MKSLAVFVTLITLIGCGRGQDGRDGEDGKPGEPGEPGKPYIPPEEIETSFVCETIWELTGEPAGRKYDLKYEVQRTKAKFTFVTLTTQYKTPKASQAPDVKNVKYEEGHEKAKSAYISTLMWEVTLSDKKAIVKRIPFDDSKEIPCH